MPLRVLDDNGDGVRGRHDQGDRLRDRPRRRRDQPQPRRLHPASVDTVRRPGLQAALERAVNAGIVVVIAAGNNSLPKCENPDVAGIVCVGGGRQSPGPRHACFSSYGSNVDLMAPGGSCAGGSSEDVLSSVINSAYDTFCGTSQAAPHVAGVAALLVSLGLRGQDAADRIVATAADSCVGLPGSTAQASWMPRPPSRGSAPPPAGPRRAHGQLLDEAAREAPRGAPSRVPRHVRRRPAGRVQGPRAAPRAPDRPRPRRGAGGHPDACQRRAQRRRQAGAQADGPAAFACGSSSRCPARARERAA